ncbi:translocation protein TolB [Bdellovibrio sp. 22V]|uniref:translocation protein TolB n=1 Tax=Bdellovibrio TaxID=958 RepID=UPI0025433C74|nr:translocation protein TolB [Bdellovibrio sp. 22V]WII70580.1 translocation protein TolB [Bdellovibrio sp. 22V]
MMKHLMALLLVLGLSPLFAQAQENGIYIKLGEARTKKSMLAFPPLQYFGSPSTASKYQSVGVELFNTITNDLTVSSYFQFISQSAFLEDTAKTGLMPAPGAPNGFKFQSWSAIGTDFLIRAGYSIVGNEVTLETYTYHVPRANLILGKKYKGPLSSARRIAHTFTNDVMKALTGKEGPFLSRIVVSSDRSGGVSKEIFVMDWDSANMEQVSSHRSISISPAWSPDGKKIAYTSYVKRVGAKFRNADMLLLDLATGRRSLVSYRQGINSGASFSPDGRHIYLTISQGNSPDIYKMTLDGNLVGKITNGPAGAMNVEPNMSQDGKLTFSSDRAGRPMIYTANADGSNVKRITFAGVFNSSPSWSPDGKKIAFAGQSEDHFDIFVMNADGTGMIRLTSAKKPNGRWASNEDPSFSPDGRFVMYTSNRTGKNQIYISTVDGTEERRVTNDNHNYFKPKWSANLD